MNFSRRQFFPLAAGMTLGLAQGSALAKPVVGSNEKHVVVIGAGASGLKAAQDLQQAGFRVTVLEARDRIGGRVHTDRSLGVPAEMGGSWIHGIQGNPIYELAQQFSLPTEVWDYFALQIFDINNQPTNQFNFLFEHFVFTVGNYAQQVLQQNRRATVRDALNAAHAAGEFEDYNVGQSGLDFLAHVSYELASGADSEWMGVHNLLASEALPGPDVVFPGGFDQLMNSLAEGLTIRTDHIVQMIHYRGDQARIQTNQGWFTADHVVITVPVGVLKAGAIRFWPNLPQWKHNALSNFDMGAVSKAYLEFPSVFWDQNVDQLFAVSEQRGQWGVWFHQDPIHGRPILAGFNSGAYAVHLERELSDEEIVSEAMVKLRSLFGSQIPQPIAHKVTRWSEDPFAYGAYAHLVEGGNPLHVEQLRRSVGGKLFFAGEATHTKSGATVHGAYLSGERVATEIVRINSP